MIIGLQCFSKQKATGLPNKMAECWISRIRVYQDWANGQ
jgi:hypothetical protein